MRFGESCPSCGFTENVNWRPAFGPSGLEIDVTEPENVPELIAQITPGIPLVEGQWTYYLPKSRRWVKRVLTIIYKAEGKWPRASRFQRLGKLDSKAAAKRRLLAKIGSQSSKIRSATQTKLVEPYR